MSDDPLQKFIDKKSGRALEYINTIEEMLQNNDGSYDYAEETLYDIQEWVTEHEYITDKQVQAVENIKNSPSKSRHGY